MEVDVKFRQEEMIGALFLAQRRHRHTDTHPHTHTHTRKHTFFGKTSWTSYSTGPPPALSAFFSIRKRTSSLSSSRAPVGSISQINITGP